MKVSCVYTGHFNLRKRGFFVLVLTGLLMVVLIYPSRMSQLELNLAEGAPVPSSG